jgi:hypothetical protein
VWQECERKIQKLAIENTDRKGLVQFWWAKLEGEELLMALIVGRLIWLRHNDVGFGRVFLAPLKLVAVARKMVEEFSRVIAAYWNE